MYGVGSPAESEIILMLCSFVNWMISSIYGLTLIGIFNANGCDVSFFVLMISFSMVLIFIVPQPIVPSPPAFETAATKLGLLIFPIPPKMIGYLILNNSVIVFFIFNTPYKVRS